MSACYQLVEQLADGRFHSGESLGQCLGVSRAAIWKQVRGLQNMGFVVHAVRGKGYRLANSLELLDQQLILASVNEARQGQITGIELFHELSSTNEYLRQRKGIRSGTVCLAERQTQGRGRRGRRWISPYGANLYLSLLWRFDQGVTVLGGLSLVVGLALLRTMREFGVGDAGLKWPNDVHVQGAKLAGILIEIAGETAGPCSTVIGIGINVAMPDPEGQEIDQRWIDLARVTSEPVSRNRLAGRLLEQLITILQEFEASGLSPFVEEWQRYDIAMGREVQVQFGEYVVLGKGSGIDVDGAFLLDTGNGLRRFASGEVSLRITE